MSVIDWIVLVLTLLAVIGYGLYKSKSEKTLDGYFKSSNSMSWILILLSIMGTQASAITFLSAPGQAYTDGMRFVQYYFGLPLAMVVLCVTFIPIYHKLKVFTAYEPVRLLPFYSWFSAHFLQGSVFMPRPLFLHPYLAGIFIIRIWSWVDFWSFTL